MNILLFSRYSQLGASSRLRFYQYIPYLESKGFTFNVSSLLNDNYILSLYRHGTSFKLLHLWSAYLERFRAMRNASSHDVVWVEKEMLPWLPAWIEYGLFPSDVPLAVDYDDAVFHRYDRHRFYFVRSMLGRKIDVVMKRADLVIVGNDYLECRAHQAGAQKIEQLPTVVDIERYRVSNPSLLSPVTIGWIGSPATARYLHELSPVYRDWIPSKSVRWVAVGANPDQLTELPFLAQTWTEDTEVAAIQAFDIGIMPLPDLPFERGKCGYKLIQYMACGKPVIASPVGINAQIVRHGIDGFLAKSPQDWINALSMLVEDTTLRHCMGLAARKRVEEHYSLQVTAPKLAALLHSLAS